MLKLGLSLILALGAGAAAMACFRVVTRLQGKLRLGLGLMAGIATIALMGRSLSILFERPMPEWWNWSVSSAYSLGMIVFWLRLEGHLKNGG